MSRADNRPRVHVWPNRITGECQISFGPTATRSRQHFPGVAAAVEAARMHAGGFDKGAVIIVEAVA